MTPDGESEWPGAYSLELMRDDVVALIDELGVARASFVGHSMGGSVAYLLTLVVSGGPASHLPRRTLYEFAGRLPGGRLVTIPTGHRVHITEPDRFLVAVVAFLGD